MKSDGYDKEKERRDGLHQPLDSAAKDAKPAAVSIYAYSLASQRRAIAYGRARGNV